jgi:predicted RNase H-like nuclease (RuvC/YqgF family)
MDDTTLEEQELDGGKATSELADDSQNDSTGDNTDPEQKNKSNWKNLSKAKKDLERKLELKDKENATLKSELEKVQDWANSLY